jgi:putative intracellular protease/amidase
MQIAIVLYPGFTALDFIGPYEVLRNLPDAEVRFVWHQPGPVTADSGALIVGATHSFDETPSPDLLLVPGGMTTFEHARDQKLLDWVRKVDAGTTWTASVCSAVPTLKAFGVTPVSDERIVTEGKIVTGAGVSAGIDLGMWLAGQIAGEAKAKAIQLAIEYDPQPPFDSGHLSKASAATKATAAAMMSKDLMKPAQLKATTLLLWEQAIRTARGRGKKRHPAISVR